MTAKRTESELIKEAIQVQNACNLSGVVHSFAKAMEDLCDLAVESNKHGTGWRNTHRVARLYADKIKSLTGELLDGDFDQNNLTNIGE